MRGAKTPEEILRKFTKQSGDCLIWTKSRSHRNSAKDYGNLWHEGRVWQAHRFLYHYLVGPIPVGAHLHHVCRVSSCVNPAHLMPVTPQQHTNIEPGSPKNRTHCPHGHEYTPENTKRQYAKGSNGKKYWKRICRMCHRADFHRRKQQRHIHQSAGK